MSFPSKNDILIGICFVFVGILFALSDRWLIEEKSVGSQNDSHVFDHMILMWFGMQLLQVCMLPVWFAIDHNWLGFACFRHGDIAQRAGPRPKVNDRGQDNQGFQEVEDGNDHLTRLPRADIDTASQIMNADNFTINDNDEEDETDNKELVPFTDGEIPVRLHRNKGPSPLIYLPPALCALAHVMLLYFGLKLTYNSSFIMLKGSVTLFTALLSIAFLAQQLPCYVWCGVLVASSGFAISGISDYVRPPSTGFEPYGVAAGNLLIVMAQIMFATKIILEEKYIRQHSIHPMKFLGCEAMFGLCFSLVFLIVFILVDADQYASLPSNKLEDITDAMLQLRHSWKLHLAVYGALIFYILYTYLGLFLVRDHGALPRIMIETFVWSIYWAVCLALKWETFFIAQVPGLCIISIGALIYSHILVLPFSSRLEGIDNANADFRNNFMELDRPDGDETNARRNGQQEPENTDDQDQDEGAREHDALLQHRQRKGHYLYGSPDCGGIHHERRNLGRAQDEDSGDDDLLVQA